MQTHYVEGDLVTLTSPRIWFQQHTMRDSGNTTLIAFVIDCSRSTTHVTAATEVSLLNHLNNSS